MIEWKKFDPNNPPEKFKNYLVYTGGNMTSAWYDLKGSFSDEMVFHKITDGKLEGYVSGVTHYAELNLPED